MNNGIINLDKLTDQIYGEGIEKAEKKSKAILEEAEADKERILQEAQEEASKIVTEAKNEAAQLQRSVVNELELKGKQFLNDLKVRIEDLLMNKIIKTNTEEAFTDVKFMQTVIFEVIKCWNADEDLELILPAALEKKVKGSFARSIQEVAPNLSVTFENCINGGFRISRKSDNYQLSFSDEDFIEIFRPYLSEQTDKLLFREAK